mmetsp:Transcript_16372/g.45219  ORF Transcript_16372/g.45219 Transcript_16372/m.45219 type:complete len:366 (-) Transcript_16372:593-1690(-)|eukprot:CAMPEP_0172363632 /NCGR_PEP_ID=MMETSP1060-20121228/6926_1 /TAXON_ID=37318 /ORGANISM="Pseudo-nitzschia pungens, Strain cf. cingulata" /LENGTH=365 /DNA_ID=CAMNT_0013086403 /DNA_START=134 /DNA_END=1231 /DNA_ORIENTATION=+
MAIDNHFQDEPFEDIAVSTGKVQFEGLKQATSKAERRRERRRRRYELVGKITACVLLVCIIIGIILAVTLVKEAEHVLYQDSTLLESASPSMSPTIPKPTISTPSPTVVRKPTFHVRTPPPTVRHTASPNVALYTDSPTSTTAPTSVIVESYSFEPSADTYVYLDGPYIGMKYGSEDKLWVQRGNKDKALPGKEATIPTIVGIIAFDTTKETETSKALPKRSRWPEDENQVKVTLRINHVVKKDTDENDEIAVADQEPLNMDIYRLPNNHNWVVESLTGQAFNNAPKSVTSGVLVTQTKVKPTDSLLNIDVTSAMFLPEGTVGYKDDQVMFMLKVYWEDSAREGDRFETRESDGKSPQLIFTNMV